MKCIFLKLTAFAMLATASASGVYASSESDEPSSTTPQSLRGSFLDENEDADWWGGWGNDLSKCTSNCHCYVGVCDMPKCTSNCQCYAGKCEMHACTSNCQARAGWSTMPACRSNCNCPAGHCNMSGCTSNCQCWWGSCDQTECRSNCGCNTGGGGACKRGHNEGDSEDVGIDQSFSGEDEEEYDTGDFEHDEDEELDEADAFAQA
mmetsp:Transcript_483/g.950  ORF Transcript_483/g.950 Transcript_483/m.950 type:complete len:206 (-) Transcript_483:241-858(-)